jgi:hypothetical protein
MTAPRDALDGDSIAFVLAAQMRGLIEALRQPDVLLSSGLDPERARAWILRCATDDPTLYRYLARGEFMAPDGTITKDPAAHAAATVSDEALWQALTRSFFASYNRLRAKSARSQAAHSPGSLSAAEIAALTRIAEALKPYIDLIARFRPDPESRQAP